jgi:hypothetical protein
MATPPEFRPIVEKDRGLPMSFTHIVRVEVVYLGKLVVSNHRRDGTDRESPSSGDPAAREGKDLADEEVALVAS